MRKNILAFFLILGTAAYSQIPGTLAYQGVLTDGSGNPVPDGNHTVIFKFYDVATGGSTLILEGQILLYGPFEVETFKGLFTFVIGDNAVAGNPPLPSAIGNQQVWLGVSPDNLPELAPRVRLTSVPYSFRAAVSDEVVAVDAIKITSGTLDNARLDADLQDLADGTLSGTKIGTGIDAGNITVGSLPDSRLSTNLQDLADGSLTGSKIGAGISATNITTGTMPDARFESTVDINSLNVGSTSQFAVSSTGNITKLNNVTTSFPSAQGAAGTFLSNNGTGTLTWSPIDATIISSGTLNDSRLSAHLQDLADGSLTGSKIGTGISATNITVGTIPDGRLESTVDINSLNVGSTSQFAVSSTGNITKLNNVTTSFPATQGAAGTFLSNNGTGTLAWSPIDAANIGSGTLSDARLSTHLQDLADGSLTGSKVGTGIDASNITIGIVPDARLSTHLQDLADGLLSGTKLDVVAGTNITLTPVGSSLSISSPNDVRSINGLTGAMNIYGGTNISLGTVGNNITINSNSPNGNGVDNELVFWTSTTSIGSANSIVWDDKGPRLGIGATTPAEKLHVMIPKTENNRAGILVDNLHDGVNPKSGVVVNIDAGGTGFRQGLAANVVRGNSNTNVAIGVSSELTIGTGSALSYGMTSLLTNNGSGAAYLYNGIITGGGSGTKFGIHLTGESMNYFSGSVGIGTSATTYKLQVNGTSFLNGEPHSTQAGFTVTSDRRTKRSVRNFEDGLEKLLQINPVRFKYNGLGGTMDDDREKFGVIAQDIQKVAPYMVSTEKRKLEPTDSKETDMLVYNSSALTYILVNAVKEQQNQIEELRKEVESLKVMVSQMTQIQKESKQQSASSKSE